MAGSENKGEPSGSGEIDFDIRFTTEPGARDDVVEMVDMRCPKCDEVITRIPRTIRLPSHLKNVKRVQQYADEMTDMIRMTLRLHFAEQHPDDQVETDATATFH